MGVAEAVALEEAVAVLLEDEVVGEAGRTQNAFVKSSPSAISGSQPLGWMTAKLL